MPVHKVPLEECLRRARLVALEPPAVLDFGDGKGLRPLTPAERKIAKAKVVKRAEQYARWRVAAYEAGDCVNPY